MARTTVGYITRAEGVAVVAAGGDVDYEKGSGRTKYQYDELQHGPITGLTIAF